MSEPTTIAPQSDQRKLEIVTRTMGGRAKSIEIAVCSAFVVSYLFFGGAFWLLFLKHVLTTPRIELVFMLILLASGILLVIVASCIQIRNLLKRPGRMTISPDGILESFGRTHRITPWDNIRYIRIGRYTETLSHKYLARVPVYAIQFVTNESELISVLEYEVVEDLRSDAFIVDTLAPANIERDNSFLELARKPARPLVLPLRSPDWTRISAPLRWVGYLEFTFAAMIRATSSSDTHGNIMFATFSIIGLLFIWLSRRQITQYVIEESQLGRWRNGGEVDGIPWREFTHVEIVVPSRSGNPWQLPVRLGVLPIRLTRTKGKPIVLPPQLFDAHQTDLWLTLDALLPETCVRDQSFLECLARAKAITDSEHTNAAVSS